jgi:hypothetical protein
VAAAPENNCLHHIGHVKATQEVAAV